MSQHSTFSLFPRLPFEIQFTIFEHAFFSTLGVKELLATLNRSYSLYVFFFWWDLNGYLFCRMVIKGLGIGNALNIFFTLESGLPALLHACRSSRNMAMKQWRGMLCETMGRMLPEKNINQYDPDRRRERGELQDTSGYTGQSH